MLLVRCWFGYRDVPLALAYDSARLKARLVAPGSVLVRPSAQGARSVLENKSIQNVSIYTRVSSLLAQTLQITFRHSAETCLPPTEILVARSRLALGSVCIWRLQGSGLPVRWWVYSDSCGEGEGNGAGAGAEAEATQGVST